MAVRIATPSSILGRLTARYRRGAGAGAVERGDEMHLLRRQLHRNGAQLLVDVVLPKPLGEGRELALDIGGLLRLQLRRAEIMVAGTVTGGARRNPACGVPGKSQANGGIVFAKGMPGLKMLADEGRQAVGTAREVSPDIGKISRRQRLRDRVHRTPRPLSRAKI